MKASSASPVACPTTTLVFLLALNANLGAQILSGTVWDTAANTRVAAARVILLQIDSSQSMVTVEIMPIHVIAKSRRPPTALELFEQRRKSSGYGYFLDEKALARVYAIETTDFLRRIPGVIVERDYVRLRSYCGEPIFVVDGIEFRPPAATQMANSIVSPSEIAAIEVYKDAAPPELQSGLSANWPCGVVVIWTKRR
ncbi:MAG: TonB-dependent receptor [Gemmatimonadota bacterium]